MALASDVPVLFSYLCVEFEASDIYIMINYFKLSNFNKID